MFDVADAHRPSQVETPTSLVFRAIKGNFEFFGLIPGWTGWGHSAGSFSEDRRNHQHQGRGNSIEAHLECGCSASLHWALQTKYAFFSESL
jgi:hypothetical protein